MLLARLHVAHAEQDGEDGHQQRDDEGGVEEHRPAASAARRLVGAGQRREGGGDRLELQRDVRQHADGGDQVTATATARLLP